MSSQHVGLIERFYNELWNRFDKSLFPEILAEDLEFRGSLGREIRGHVEFAEYVDFIQRAFPDFHNRIEDIVSEGDQSFVRLSYTGTHEGAIFGVPATGRRIHYAGAALFRFSGSKVASVWVLGDIHGLLRQLAGE